MKKHVVFIRHGYALHNKLFSKIGKEAYSDYVDTPLLNEGYNQAFKLREHINKFPDLVLVSPLTRTLQTTQTIFSNDINQIALDCLVEYPQGGFEKCNIRKSKKLLKTIYTNIDFTEIDQNLLWSSEEETIDELNGRISKLWNYIGTRKEKLIAVVSHSSYIGQLKDKIIGDEQHELKHCYPYEMIVEYDDEKNFLKAYEVTNGIVEGMSE